MSTKVLKIKLTKESKTVSHSFIAKLNGHTTCIIENASDSFYAKGWFNYRPFSSKDGIIWNRTSKGNFNGSSFSFNVSEDDKFISWYVPYSLKNFNNLLSNINLKNINAELKSLESGLPYISIGDTSKNCLVLMARQHPGESMSSFFLDGVIKYLFKLSKQDIKDHSFIIIPFVNLQGVENNTHRYDLLGVDYNRSWNKKNNTVINEVLNLIKSLNCSMVIDIHGDEVSKSNYVMYEGVKSPIKSYYLNVFSSCDFLILKAQPFIKKFIKNIIINKKIILPKGKASAREHLTSLNLNALTVELSAHKSDHIESEKLGADFIKKIIKNSK